MSSDKILDSRLQIRLDLDVSLKANSFYHTNPKHRAHFVSQLLLYNSIVIPTNDFGIIPILISWLGLGLFREAISSNTIEFVKLNSFISYGGNGKGISEIKIEPNEKKPFKWWQKAIFGDIESAIDLQLRYQCPFISKKVREKLVYSIRRVTKQFDYDNDCFKKNICDESYSDIINEPKLFDFILKSESLSKKNGVSLNRLTGINKNQFRFLNLESIKDGIDLLLRVAEINREILLSFLYGGIDLGTSEGAQLILKNKLSLSGISPSTIDKFISLLELNNIPDIRPAIEYNELSLINIWRLRKKHYSKKFRKWLRKSNAENSRELEKLYVKSLGKRSIFSSLPVRKLRFAITTSSGLIGGPIASTAMESLNYYAEKLIRGYSPKLFLDKLGNLLNK